MLLGIQDDLWGQEGSNSLFGMMVKVFSMLLFDRLAEHVTFADFLNCWTIGPLTVDPSTE
jgi:hypothetical protein